MLLISTVMMIFNLRLTYVAIVSQNICEIQNFIAKQETLIIGKKQIEVE